MRGLEHYFIYKIGKNVGFSNKINSQVNFRLLRAKNSIPRIAQPWQDIAVVIELAVDRRSKDGDIGVRGFHCGDAFGAG